MAQQQIHVHVKTKGETLDNGRWNIAGKVRQKDSTNVFQIKKQNHQVGQQKESAQNETKILEKMFIFKSAKQAFELWLAIHV